MRSGCHHKGASSFLNNKSTAHLLGYPSSVGSQTLLGALDLNHSHLFKGFSSIQISFFLSSATSLFLSTESFPSAYIRQHHPLDKRNPLLTSNSPPATIYFFSHVLPTLFTSYINPLTFHSFFNPLHLGFHHHHARIYVVKVTSNL